jgi:transposase
MSKRTRRCEPVQSNLVVIGIDVAKKSHVAVAARADGGTMKPLVFAASRDGFAALHAYGDRAVADAGASGWVVGMEPTGHYGQPLGAWLRAEDVPVFMVQPQHTSRAKEFMDGTSRKTDAKDAAVIADLVRRGIAQPLRTQAETFAALRVLSKQREQLVKRRTQVTNRLHRHVEVVFPEFGRVFPKMQGATPRWLLRNVASPVQLLAMPREELLLGLHKASRGQVSNKRLEALLEAARSSVGVQQSVDAHQLAIRQSLDEMDTVLAHIAEVERSMKLRLKEVPYAAELLSVPRLGEITVATLLGEFGDLRDYRVARQLIAMAGLDLVETSSGQRKGQRHISRRGRAYARQILFMAALRLGGGALAEPRRRMAEVNKVQPTKAAVANMRRLLRILHALARDGQRFDPSRFAPKQALDA